MIKMTHNLGDKNVHEAIKQRLLDAAYEKVVAVGKRAAKLIQEASLDQVQPEMIELKEQGIYGVKLVVSQPKQIKVAADMKLAERVWAVLPNWLDE